MKGILGKKVGMTQIFNENGVVATVTVIEAGPCVVLQKKEVSKDGYEAIQLGFKEKKEHRATRPEIGHAKKVGAKPQQWIREICGVNPNNF
jgi:large subunit ribosomal protein L3